MNTNLRVVEPSLDPGIYEVNTIPIVFNALLLYGFGAVTLIVPTLLGVAQRGFFCDDDTIRYEYRSDTVSSSTLIVYNLLLNAITVVIVEWYRMKIVENKISAKYRWRKYHLHVLFVRIMTYCEYSHLGFVINLALNVVTKHVVGRLRPHFLDVCKLAVDVCSDAENQHKYITNYTCTGDAKLILDARKSFYSGHSAISMYCAIWSALYIQARFSSVIYNRIIVPIIQTVIVLIGLGISYSRITDNKHHWSDVLVGIIVGIFIASYTCKCWTPIFSNNKSNDEVTPLLIATKENPTTSDSSREQDELVSVN